MELGNKNLFYGRKINEEFLKLHARKIFRESDAYQKVGKKCHFCRGAFSEYDAQTGNIMNSQLDHSAHYDCLTYIMKKYPKIAMSELEGKIERTRVDDALKAGKL